MMENFYGGNLNLSMFDYGMIVLIPKLKKVDNIK
jgi:hypothetical protein